MGRPRKNKDIDVEEKTETKKTDDKPKVDEDVERVQSVDEPSAATARTLSETAEKDIPKGDFSDPASKLGVTEGSTTSLKEAVDKVKIKLNKFGSIIAESEQFIYYKWHLNRLMTDTEIEEEKKEIIDDVNIVIDNRIKVLSKYGDLVNILIDFMSHLVTRAFRFYANPANRDKVMKSEGNGQTTLPNGEPDFSLSDEDMRNLGIRK